MEFKFNDGGRAKAGFKGFTGDCVTRSIAIVTGKPYLEVYDEINQYCKVYKKKKGKSSARTGVHRDIIKRTFVGFGIDYALKQPPQPFYEKILIFSYYNPCYSIIKVSL
jgi:hypothetical protein